MTPDELPPSFRNLGARLREAAARDIESERRRESQIEGGGAQRVRRWRGRRWLLVAAAAILTAGGVAVAGRTLDRTGRDEPRDRTPRNVSPAGGSIVISESARPDPRSGPPWALRVFRNAVGEDCVALGRLKDGALGTYDAARTFRRLPPNSADICERLREVDLLVTAQWRGEPERRTIVYGRTRGVRPVRVTIGGRTHTLQPGRLGTFVDVRAGVLDLRGATASTSVGGRTVTRPLR
jgi:hypothetical protein